MKEIIFLTQTTPDDFEVLISNMKVNNADGPNSIPTKTSNQNFPNLDMINTFSKTVIFSNALKVTNIIPIQLKQTNKQTT